MADEVDNAGLDDGLREDGRDRVGEPLQPVGDGDQDVADAARLQLVHDAKPELGAFGLLDPQGVAGVQWAVLPFGDFLQHGVGDHRDKVGRDIDAVKLFEMPRISRTVMPRAYIEMIFSSKSGKRR